MNQASVQVSGPSFWRRLSDPFTRRQQEPLRFHSYMGVLEVTALSCAAVVHEPVMHRELEQDAPVHKQTQSTLGDTNLHIFLSKPSS